MGRQSFDCRVGTKMVELKRLPNGAVRNSRQDFRRIGPGLGVCDGQAISKRVRRGRNDIKSMLPCAVRTSVTLDFLFSGSILKHYLQP